MQAVRGAGLGKCLGIRASKARGDVWSLFFVKSGRRRRCVHGFPLFPLHILGEMCGLWRGLVWMMQWCCGVTINCQVKFGHLGRGVGVR